MALPAQAAPPTNGAHAELISLDPRDGAELGRAPIRSAAEAREAVARARAAQARWAALPLSARLAYLRRLRAALAGRAEELAALTAREMGKTPTEALSGDVMLGLMHLDYAIRQAPKLLRPRRLRHGSLFVSRWGQVILEPRGVIGIIAPYNYPVLMTTSTLCLALAAGNAVVAKPSEHTPLTALKLAEICAGVLPTDLFQTLTGDHTTGAALIESGIDSLVFVGGTTAGRKIAAAAGARLLPVVMELGGSNAMIVLEDADLEFAARGAVWGAYVAGGQVCARVARVLVAAPVADRFLAAVAREAARVRPTAPDGAGDLGPLTAAAGLGHVRLAVEEALAGGARLVAGALPPPYPGAGPAVCPPLVLAGVTPAMRVMREEVFGPVLAVYPVGTIAEAVRLANDTPYSLTASVWGRDRRRAYAVARRVRAGSVLINDHLASAFAPESPWGGMGGASGYGRIGGAFGLAGLTHPKYIGYDRLPVRRYPWWYPYTGESYRVSLSLLGLLYGPRLADRLRGLRALVANLRGVLRLYRG
jgi:acyl-CoA reductase-like NAD-dependent aldehyde dehydrogenase